MPQENNNATPSSTFLENRRREREKERRKQEEINQNVQSGTYTKEDYLPSSESIDASVEDTSTIYQFNEKEIRARYEKLKKSVSPSDYAEQDVIVALEWVLNIPSKMEKIAKMHKENK